MLRRVSSIIAILCIGIVIGEVATAQPTPPDTNIEWVADHWEVYPTGNSAQDKSNIQWTIDQGGRILLKAYAKGTTTFTPFVFKQTGFQYNPDIVIGNNCLLEGEILKERYPGDDPYLAGQNKMTEIIYGALCFAINTPWAHIGAYEVKIRNLVSREAETHFLAAYQDCDVEIDNVKVIELTPDANYWALIAILSHNSGRWVVKNCLVRHKYAPGVSENLFEMGIGVAWAPAEIEITNNDVVTHSAKNDLWGGHGIGVAWSGTPGGSIIIKDNTVTANGAGITTFQNSGIWLIDHNDIRAGWLGIWCESMSDSVVTGNNVNMADGSIAGIELHSANSNTTQGNKITGNGLYGIGLYRDSTDNVFMGNNLNTFNEDAFKVYFDDGSVFGEPFPQGNSYVGNGGVVNESAATYNTITGLEPIAGTFNEEGKNAIAEAAQKLSKWPTDEWHPGQPDVQQAPARRHKVSPNNNFPVTWGWMKK